MVILIDKKKLPYDEVKKVLEKEGFKRTTSRRYIRYERVVGNRTEGVELEKYDTFTSVKTIYIRYYEEYKIDAFVDNWFGKLSDCIMRLFKPYERNSKEEDNGYAPDFNEQGQINNGFNMHNID